MNQKQFLIVANWKMNPRTSVEAKILFTDLGKKKHLPSGIQVVIAPPFPFLLLGAGMKKIQLGAQDVFWEPVGSYTGEVSAPMLKSLGVSHVILGHSERRRHLLESNEVINKKLKYALKAGLHPIVCVGELTRDPDGAFFAELRAQIEATCAHLSKSDLGKIVIAYEPVWAIGSGKPARPQDANEAALFIKKVLAQRYGVAPVRKLKIIYGGSVNARNAASFLEEKEIEGLLVGRESLKAKEFLGIVECTPLNF